MPREEGSSWERFGRRFNLRLSLKRPEEKALMDEYDRRSELLGKDDKEFLKNCLVAGFRILVNEGILNNHVASYSNESNNTVKQQTVAASAKVSSDVEPVRLAAPVSAPVQVEAAAPAVPAKSVLGRLMRHT